MGFSLLSTTNRHPKLILVTSPENTRKLKPKTATGSWRLDESALQALQEDAKKQNVSVNTLLNQLVLTYANFDRPMKRFQMVKMPASTFRYILEGAKDESIIAAGTTVGNDVPKTYILARWGEVTVENCLEYLQTMSNNAKLYEFSEVVHGGNISVTLSHNFGAKGNLFLKHLRQGDIRPVGQVAEVLGQR